MVNPKAAGASAIVSYLSGLRFPVLLLIVGTLFLLNLVIPDPIPFVDEILLGLLTALFASWRKRRAARPAAGSAARSDRGDHG